eukprot:COSAG02_NODE_485_length_21365_cov_9.452584_8_plen_46_part_00
MRTSPVQRYGTVLVLCHAKSRTRVDSATTHEYEGLVGLYEGLVGE